MKTYVVEFEDESWVLRRFGVEHQIHRNEEFVAVRDYAFDRLRRWAPCTIRVLGKSHEEWRLDGVGGNWEKKTALLTKAVGRRDC